MPNRLTCHGAAETVTGSRHLVETNGKNILVDCGLFQGSSELKQRNWAPFPIDPRDIDAVVLTHAHMDHIGYLPRLVKHGFQGPIYCTQATAGLVKISLPDSGRIQEEDARRANKHNYSRHKPALPLYTEQDAYAVFPRLEKVKYDEFHPLPGGAQWRYLPAGHILGSAFVEMYFENGEKFLFSGDLGRYDTAIIKDPTPVDFAEYLMIESTYGDRIHPDEDTLGHLEQILRNAFESGGTVIVPSFAIGRTQELLYAIHELQDQNRLPRIPIFIDSPMAISTTELYRTCYEEHDEEMQAELKMLHAPLEPEGVTFVRDREQSKALNSTHGPMVIIAGSGMVNGGRVVHHILHRIENPSTTILFTGYQAEGTLGRRILEKTPMVRIMGQEVAVRANVDKLNALSAHADQADMMRWLGNFKTPPKKTFIVHGEPRAQIALQGKIQAELGWTTAVPRQGEGFELGG